MNEDQHDEDGLCPTDAVIDSLLVSLHEDESRRENRIERLLDRYQRMPTRTLDEGSVTAEHVPVAEQRSVRFSRRRVVRAIFSIATVVLLMGSLWIALSPPNAEAALSRAAEMLNLPVTRVYDVEFTMQEGTRGPSRRTGTLYSHSRDHFLLDFERARVQPLLLGANPTRRWARIGPRIWRSDDASEQNFPASVLLDRVSIRQLRFNEMLTQLPKDFDLQLLENATLDGESKPLRRIEAVRRFIAPSMPARVVVWIDPITDITQQIEVYMRPGSQSRVASLVARYRSEETFDESLFAAESN